MGEIRPYVEQEARSSRFQLVLAQQEGSHRGNRPDAQ